MLTSSSIYGLPRLWLKQHQDGEPGT
jgi:hypothetical protein